MGSFHGFQENIKIMRSLFRFFANEGVTNKLMNDEQRQLLSLHEPPARLITEQVAMKLNFANHDIPVLVRAKLLRPLGNPSKCSVKYFAAVEIYRLAQDPAWLGKATNAIYAHWHGKSERRRNGGSRGEDCRIAA